VSKKYTAYELKCILKEVLERGYTYIEELRSKLVELKLSDTELKESPKGARLLEAERLMMLIASINDIIHPAHSLSLQLFPNDTHLFIEQCIKQYNELKKLESTTLKEPRA
jgi:hypothetical protein